MDVDKNRIVIDYDHNGGEWAVYLLENGLFNMIYHHWDIDLVTSMATDVHKTTKFPIKIGEVALVVIALFGSKTQFNMDSLI